MTGAVSCPHCGKQFAFVPDLAGSQVGCPHCQRPLRMPELKEMDPPAIPHSAPMIEDPVVETKVRSRPRFRPREYAWLQGVRIALMIAGTFCVAVFVLGEAAVIGTSITAVRAREQRPTESPTIEALGLQWVGAAFFHAIVQFTLIAGCLWPALMFFATAQLLALMMDVQANTEEAAYHLRYLHY